MIKRRYVFAFLVAFIASIICSICAFSAFDKKTASASLSVEVPTASENVIIASNGFMVKDGASIRLTGKAIKFTTNVSKEFHDSLDGEVVYFATMRIAGNSNVMAVAFGDQPSFEDANTCELNAYLNFASVSQEVLSQAIVSEFETATYAKVVNGNQTIYYMAANSNGVRRSMRAVANDAYLNFEEGIGYEREDILDLGYFETANVNGEVTGSLVSNTLSFSMPEYPEPSDGTNLIAYVGAKKVDVVYNQGTYTGKTNFFVPLGDAVVTLFGQNNFAYTTKVSVQAGQVDEEEKEDVDFDINDFFPDHTHVLGEWEIVTIASCNEQGVYAKKCSVCGDNILFSYVPRTPHNAGDWQTIVQVDCLTDGEEVKVCLDCGTVAERKFIEKTAHDQSEWKVEIEPTCDQKGIRVKTCSACGNAVASEPIPTISHTEGDWVIVREATCSQEGVQEKKCIICETTVQSEIIQKTAHVLGSWEVDLVATCVKQGREIQKCTVCGEQADSKTTQATGIHVESNWLPDAETNLAVKQCKECNLVLETKPLDQIEGTAIRQSNIGLLQTATSGYYYLVEDIDMWAYTSAEATTPWNPTSTFTGAFDGNGFTIKNFAGITAGDYKGLFYQTGTGAVISNVQIEMLYFANKSGIIGKVTGETLVENVVIRADMLANNESSPIVHTASAKLTIKDSLVVVGGGYASSTSYRGYLFGGSISTRTTPSNVVLDSVVVLNHGEFTTISGTSSLVGKPKGVSGSTAVEGKDYFVYTKGADLLNAQKAGTFTLPEFVIEGAEKVRAIVPISYKNASNLSTLIANGCGYFYLTEDIDMQVAGVTSYVAASAKSQKISNTTYYHGAINIEIDGQGHKITNLKFSGANAHNALVGTTSGASIKNLSIHADSLGGGNSYATLFFAIARAYPGSSGGGKYLYENLSITVDVFETRNAGILVGHNNIVTTQTMKNVFINIVAAGGSTALFAGYNTLASSTTIMQNVFVICPNTSIPNSINSAAVYKDASGNTITPGGSGTYDTACIIKTSYGAMESAGILQRIQDEIPTLFALDKLFFSGNAHEHVEGGWVKLSESTCEEEGKRVQKCTICDTVLAAETVEKKPHVLGEWQKDLANLKVYQECLVCTNVVEEGVILTSSNITLLKSATNGTYYLNEDIDMSSVTANDAWYSSSTFTGKLLGNGHMLYNFTANTSAYQGLFHKVGTGGEITDLTFKVKSTNGRFGLIGYVVGSAKVERVVVYIEKVAGSYASPFAHVIQGSVLVKDSFAFIGSDGSCGNVYSGYLFGGEAMSYSPIVQNTYVVNLNASIAYAIGGSAKYPVHSVNAVNAVKGVDYFYYNSVSEFNSAIASSSVHLPDSVIEQIVDVGVIASHTHVEGSQWITVIAPTCTEVGSMVTKCTVCGVVMSRKEAPVASHTYGDVVVVKVATCVSKGSRARQCEVCGVYGTGRETSVDANNHVNIEWIIDEYVAQNGISRIYKFCNDCHTTVSEHDLSKPEYHNTSTDTFSIWAYGATPGKYIQHFVDLNGNGFDENSVNYSTAGYTYEEYLNLKATSTHKDSSGQPKEVLVRYLNEFAPVGVKQWYDAVANGGNGDGKITVDDRCDRNGDGVWDWDDNSYSENCYFYLFDRGDGTVEYIRRDLYQYYYYQDNGNGTRTLKKSDTPVTNCIKESEAVFMFDEGALDVYAEANFNTLFFTFGSEISYDNFAGTYAESIFDLAYERGMEVIASGSYFHHMTSQKTPLIDPENGIKFTQGASISSDTTKFKTQNDVNEFVIYHLRNIIKHPAFKGVTFIDEPSWECFVAMGQLAQGIKAAEEYYGREIYVMENLFPYAHSAGHWSLYNGIGLTSYDAYIYYLDAYYENVGKYLGYVQYDDYPVSGSLIPYYIRSHQVTSEWAREKGINRAIAMQSYGDKGTSGKQACSPEDILWQGNISAAFGCKDFTYYTYFPIINVAEGVDGNGEEFVVDRYGNPTKTYPGVQQLNAELALKGKALLNFQYEDLHYYTNGTYTNYFFEGCTSAKCQDCAVVQGELKFVNGAVLAFDGAVLITELVDEENGYYGYYIVNITEPRELKGGEVTIEISDLFNSAQVYHGTSVKTKSLVDGKLTLNLGAGDGAFIIPYNV